MRNTFFALLVLLTALSVGCDPPTPSNNSVSSAPPPPPATATATLPPSATSLPPPSSPPMASAGNGASNERHTGEGRVRAENHPISIIPPQDFIRQKSDNDSVVFLFKGPAESGFARTFSVGADSYRGKQSVEQLLAQLKSELPPSFTLLEDGITTIDNKKALFLRAASQAQGRDVVNVQYFVPTGRTMYSISFMSSASAFDNYQATRQSVLNSVHAD